MKKIFCIICGFYSISALAVQDFADFQIKFEETRNTAEKGFAKALNLKPFFHLYLQSSNELNEKECALLKEKIKKNYAVDPFLMETDEGDSFIELCLEEKRANRLIKAEGLSNQNQAYSMILEKYHKRYKTYSYVFLNSDFKIVELQRVSTNYDMNFKSIHFQKSQKNYMIQSQDDNNNIYILDYFEDENMIKTYQKFLPADGTSPELNWKENYHNKKNPSKDYQELHFAKADIINWDRYEIPITHAVSTGFYFINGQYHLNNNYYSTMVIKTKKYNNQPCAYGWEEHNDTSIAYPADKKEREDCALNF